MTPSQMAALETPITDAHLAAGRGYVGGRLIHADFARSLEQRLAAATMALIDLEHNVSRINRYRDDERHPDVGIALVNARTTLALLRAK